MSLMAQWACAMTPDRFSPLVPMRCSLYSRPSCDVAAVVFSSWAAARVLLWNAFRSAHPRTARATVPSAAGTPPRSVAIVETADDKSCCERRRDSIPLRRSGVALASDLDGSAELEESCPEEVHH